MYSFIQNCDLCRKRIPNGTRYGILCFQIETLEVAPAHPNGIVTVHDAEAVNTMCLDCTSKFNNQNIKQLLD